MVTQNKSILTAEGDDEGAEGERSAEALRSELGKRMKNKIEFITGKDVSKLAPQADSATVKKILMIELR